MIFTANKYIKAFAMEYFCSLLFPSLYVFQRLYVSYYTYYLLFLFILHTHVLHIYEAVHYFVRVKIVSCLFNMQRYKVSVITVINCRFSHASFFRTSSQNTWKRPIKPLLQPPKLHAPTRSYPRDSCNYGAALGFDFKAFFPGCIAMQRASRLPSPSINGTWKV